MDKPRIDNAPGLAWRTRAGGTWVAVWIARQDLVKRGFRPQTQRLWTGTSQDLDHATADYIRDECSRLQNEMLGFGRGETRPVTFDGRMSGLIEVYLNDKDSPFHAMRYVSRRQYQNLLDRLNVSVGDRALAALNFRDFKNWYEQARWPDGRDGERDMPSMGHRLITIVRIVMNFGAAMELPDCDRLALVLSKMEFENGRARTQELTAEMAQAIIDEANRLGHRSIADAQAFQFELTLRQKDVIGEWVPMSEPGVSETTWQGKKWLRGLHYREIDSNLILAHPLSKSRKGKVAEFALNHYPMVMAQLAKIPIDQRTGPLIIDELTGRPYTAVRYRRLWRRIADRVGIPKSIRNMDSRAGGLTESSEVAGDNIEAVRQQALHSDSKTTHRYMRGGIRKRAELAKLRVKHRKKDG